MAKRQDGTEGYGRRLRFFCRCTARSGCCRICYSGSIPESSHVVAEPLCSEGLGMYCIQETFSEEIHKSDPGKIRTGSRSQKLILRWQR